MRSSIAAPLLALALAGLAAAASAQPATLEVPEAGPGVETFNSDGGAATLLSAEARRYLQRALDLMQEHSINRDRIDWSAFRARVMERARGARSAPDTHEALRFALRELGDGHSFLMGGARARAGDGDPAVPPGGRWLRNPEGFLVEENIGYLRVPGFFRSTHARQRLFAQQMHGLMAELQAAGACRWIVDLRDNYGGNLWPMLLGAGPLLGEGEAGAAVYPDGRRVPFWYEDGRVGYGDYTQLRLLGQPLRLPDPTPPVAVLTGPRTASSGEALAVAFRGQPRARSFGAETRGVSTGTRTFPLADGAAMVLTVATTSDRFGNIYGGAIPPDQRVSLVGSDDPRRQPIVHVASSWLREQPCA